MSPRTNGTGNGNGAGDLNVARIKVLGVGGGGGNAVNRMVQARVRGVEFLAANTDLQALKQSKAPVKLQLGAKLTKGLGAGANPEVGRQAALEDTDKLVEALEGTDMVFINAGLGGGTGTGAAPIIARLALELGALTVAVVTKPFAFEGKRRMLQAEQGLAELINCVDTLIVVPNQRLLDTVEPGTSFFEAFRIADDILRQGVQGITDIIAIPGVINRDFADVTTIMKGTGYAVMGTGIAGGPNRAAEAARQAIHSPLLEEGAIQGARGVLKHHRLLEPRPARSAGGLGAGAEGRARGRQHHLRRRARQSGQRRGEDHRHRHRLQGEPRQGGGALAGGAGAAAGAGTPSGAGRAAAGQAQRRRGRDAPRPAAGQSERPGRPGLRAQAPGRALAMPWPP